MGDTINLGTILLDPFFVEAIITVMVIAYLIKTFVTWRCTCQLTKQINEFTRDVYMYMVKTERRNTKVDLLVERLTEVELEIRDDLGKLEIDLDKIEDKIN